MTNHLFSRAAAALAITVLAGAAQAGSFDIAPGATAQVDVGDRYNYTTLSIINQGAAAGRLQLTDGRSVDVAGNGKAEVYDRLGRSRSGGSYVSVTNTGAVPLRVISSYQWTDPAP